MQTHLQASGVPNTSTRQLLEGRASSSTAQQQADGTGVEDEASDASPSPNNAGNSDVDGKQRRMSSQDGTAPPRENGEQALAELPGRKARVSVRARSEAPMVIIPSRLVVSIINQERSVFSMIYECIYIEED
jgi:hypothetical protein